MQELSKYYIFQKQCTNYIGEGAKNPMQMIPVSKETIQHTPQTVTCFPDSSSEMGTQETKCSKMLFRVWILERAESPDAQESWHRRKSTKPKGFQMS